MIQRDIEYSGQFSKDVKLAQKEGANKFLI